MDLDKIHSVVRRLNILLNHREVGLASWWMMLGNLLRELNELSSGMSGADTAEEINNG